MGGAGYRPAETSFLAGPVRYARHRKKTAHRASPRGRTHPHPERRKIFPLPPSPFQPFSVPFSRPALRPADTLAACPPALSGNRLRQKNFFRRSASLGRSACSPFSHQTRAVVTATAMPPAHARPAAAEKISASRGMGPQTLPARQGCEAAAQRRPAESERKTASSANARPYGLKRKAFQADNARTPVRSAGKYVPPAASGSERCYRASNALAGGQFLPRQIKGSPVQHRIRQESSPCCWSLCGAAWRYAEKTASLPCRWRCGRKEGSAQVYRPSEAAASHGQGIIWPAQLPARQRPLYRR